LRLGDFALEDFSTQRCKEDGRRESTRSLAEAAFVFAFDDEKMDDEKMGRLGISCLLFSSFIFSSNSFVEQPPMTITIDHPLRVLDQDQFGPIAYEVINQAFAIHKELGRFFDEDVYQNELLRRLGPRATKEVWIHATHADFRKAYRVDLLVDQGALFELKAVQQLNEQHRSQLINYLMLTGLNHGKLINFRPNRIEHEFVNNHITLAQRRAFQIDVARWSATTADARRFQELLLAMLQDWGTCLDLELYIDALSHFFGGSETVIRDVEVRSHGVVVGIQKLRLINDSTAFKLTSLSRDLESFESHVQRLLQHTELEEMLWVNITLEEVAFVSVRK